MRTLSFFCALFVVGCAPAQQSQPPGNHIVFFGDSITELGDTPGGYVTLLRDSLAREASTAGYTVIGAGKSGNKVPDLLDRVDRDVLSVHPKVVVIYIGINDVWHWKILLHRGTPKDEYERGLHTLVEKMTNADARVMLCTPTVVGERRPGTNELDPMLDEYAEISRTVARSMNVPLCDLRLAFQRYLLDHNTADVQKGILTTDEVHLNAAGNRLVMQEILKVFADSGILNSQD